MNSSRAIHLDKFYALLATLEDTLGGARQLSACTGRMDWPRRGVYFFREHGESRSLGERNARIVRVGTHALRNGAGTTLWTRLAQHRGTASNQGGNHRGSIFRLIVGSALLARNGEVHPTWGVGKSGSRHIRKNEHSLEMAVSDVIGRMPFIWLPVDDRPGPDSNRGYIERQAIALLSNYERQPLDPPSAKWLGAFCPSERVRKSGLWNQRHVDECYDPGFLDTLDSYIEGQTAS